MSAPSPARIRLAFDITELGAFFLFPGGKRGIHRVVENIFDGLVHEPGIDLVFTATGAIHDARRFQAAAPALALHSLRRSRYQEAAGWVNHRLKDYVSRTLAQRAFWRRALRLGLTHATRLVGTQEARLPASLLADRDIFHSPYGAIPGTLRKLPRLQKFLTVYDLIPIFDPAVEGGGWLRRVMGSVRPEDWLLCISQSVKDDVCNYLKHDPARVFVTPLAASPEVFYPMDDPSQIDQARTRYGIPVGKRYVLSLCAMEKRKNLRHLIRCFLQLSATGTVPDLCLVLVGRPHAADLHQLRQEFASDLAFASRVVFTGYVADVDLAAIYSGAMIFVFPSLAEGFGLPPLEAMQCGVPVISSNATSLPEVVGEAGILLDPTDTDGLCESLRRLYADEAWRAELSARGLERAQGFRWENCVAKTVGAYRVARAAGGSPAAS